MMLSMTSKASAGPTQSNVEVHAYIRSVYVCHWSFGDSCNVTTSCDLSVVAMHHVTAFQGHYVTTIVMEVLIMLPKGATLHT